MGSGEWLGFEEEADKIFSCKATHYSSNGSTSCRKRWTMLPQDFGQHASGLGRKVGLVWLAFTRMVGATEMRLDSGPCSGRKAAGCSNKGHAQRRFSRILRRQLMGEEICWFIPYQRRYASIDATAAGSLLRWQQQDGSPRAWGVYHPRVIDRPAAPIVLWASQAFPRTSGKHLLPMPSSRAMSFLLS